MSVGKVVGIGGVFLRADDPAALAAWYRDHLGIPVETWGGAVFRASGSFAPSTTPFMVNCRGADLATLLAALRTEGCAVDDRVGESEQGRLGWVRDSEGNRVELWEPPASPAA